MITPDRAYSWRSDIVTRVTTIDISDPENPDLLADTPMPFGTTALAARGNDLFFAEEEFEGGGGVLWYDFTDPANPTFMGLFGAGDPVSALAVAGDQLIVGGKQTVFAWDVVTQQGRGSVGDTRFASAIYSAADGGVYTYEGSKNAWNRRHDHRGRGNRQVDGAEAAGRQDVDVTAAHSLALER